MPDLLTHTLAIYPLKHRFPKMFSILLLGTVLPDIVGRTPGILLPYQSAINWLGMALHTPILLVLISLLLSFFFPENLRKKTFLYLMIGVFAHLFLDLFQKTLTYGYFWLFPFSFASFNIPLIWPNDSIYLIPLFVIINELFTLARFRNQLHKKL